MKPLLDVDWNSGKQTIAKAITALALTVAIVVITASPAHAAPSLGWTCHKYGPGFFQGHCHY